MKSKFGRRAGGGRRASQRASAVLPATLTRLADAAKALLLDVSSTGARVDGAELPDHGTYLLVTLAEVKATATVVWRTENGCGLRFSEPLNPYEVELLRRHARVASFAQHAAGERGPPAG
jgi:hypothetical protein